MEQRATLEGLEMPPGSGPLGELSLPCEELWAFYGDKAKTPPENRRIAEIKGTAETFFTDKTKKT